MFNAIVKSTERHPGPVFLLTLAAVSLYQSQDKNIPEITSSVCSWLFRNIKSSASCIKNKFQDLTSDTQSSEDRESSEEDEDIPAHLTIIFISCLCFFFKYRIGLNSIGRLEGSRS